MLKLFNGPVITPSGILQNGSVLIKDNKILEVQEGSIDVQDAIEVDVDGRYISPGFIDLHVHGGGGGDFMDAELDSFLTIAETHARFGTTTMFPTTLTSERDELNKTLKVYEQARQTNTKGAQFAGMHLEGPYISVNQCGAQDPKYLSDPDPSEYKGIVSAFPNTIKRWSAAPELDGALEFGRYMVENGILPAIAHTDAIYEDVVKAFDNGYNLLTHFYSAMTGVTRRNAFRYAGVIESGYLMDDMFVEIIADGVHLPPPLLKLIYKIKGPDKIALITDAMRAAGMPPGESILGSIKNGQRVIVEDGVAKLPDRSSFAGSVATADQLVRNMITLAEVDLVNAIKMITETPAKIMKIYHRKGSIDKGKDADLVVFDENIKIHKTIVNGTIVFGQ